MQSGVCTQSRFTTAEGGDAFGPAAGVSRHQPEHAGLSGHEWIVGQTADVALAHDRGGSDVLRTRLLDSNLHRAF